MLHLSNRYILTHQICKRNHYDKPFLSKKSLSLQKQQQIISPTFMLQVNENELNSSSCNLELLEVCKSIMNPKKLFEAKFLILYNAYGKSILDHPLLKTIPIKMELRKGTKDGSSHLLLWSHCNHCIDGTRFGSTKTKGRYILIGAFRIEKAYISYFEWFSDFSKSFHRTRFRAVQPVPHKMTAEVVSRY
jgi:hypothetical protein